MLIIVSYLVNILQQLLYYKETVAFILVIMHVKVMCSTRLFGILLHGLLFLGFFSAIFPTFDVPVLPRVHLVLDCLRSLVYSFVGLHVDPS